MFFKPNYTRIAAACQPNSTHKTGIIIERRRCLISETALTPYLMHALTADRRFGQVGFIDLLAGFPTGM